MPVGWKWELVATSCRHWWAGRAGGVRAAPAPVPCGDQGE